MKKPVYVLNGPNLNRLGKREPEIYGHVTLAEVEENCTKAAGEAGLVFRQTNSEERMIEWIHEAIDDSCALLINPAAFTFYSMAIMDALKMYPHPLIEYHITNVHRRERADCLGRVGATRSEQRPAQQNRAAQRANSSAEDAEGKRGHHGARA